MLSPLAITLALAFWAPYNHGQPVCPNGVHIVYDQPSQESYTGWVTREDIAARDCRFHVRADLGGQRIEYQCMIVAHELGHAAMGLPDVTTEGIMDLARGVADIPGICYPDCFQAVAGACAKSDGADTQGDVGEDVLRGGVNLDRLHKQRLVKARAAARRRQQHSDAISDLKGEHRVRNVDVHRFRRDR